MWDIALIGRTVLPLCFLALLSPVSKASDVFDPLCYTRDYTKHSLNGTAFCSSVNRENCRNDDHFSRNIKVTWNADGKPNGNTIWGLILGYDRGAKAVLPAGITISSGGTERQPRSKPEIRIHFREGRIPKDCVGSADYGGKPDAPAGVCRQPIAPGYNTIPEGGYTKGHVKCDMYVNTSLTNSMTPWKNGHTFLHEIGHCLGLSHMSRRSETMYGTNICNVSSTPAWDSSNYCRATDRFKIAIEDGYEGFYALPHDKPLRWVGRSLKLNWTPYTRWFDERIWKNPQDCFNTGYSGQLKNGATPNEKRDADDTKTCHAKIYYLTGALNPTWTPTSSTTKCKTHVCKVEC